MVYIIKSEEKMEICRKYRVYLDVIYLIGNNVMLQKQFYEICRKLNISLSDYQTRKVLAELEHYEIIKKQPFLYSKNKLIVLRKFGIRFLLNKDSSNEVSSLPKNIDKRAILSVFKTDRLLKIIDGYNIYYWDNFLDLIYNTNNNFIYKRNEGTVYHSLLISKYELDYYKQESYMRAISNRDKMLKNLESGRCSKKNEKSSKEMKDKLYGAIISQNSRKLDRRIENSTIDTMINSNIYIQTIINMSDTKIVEIIILDINNNQSANKIIEDIAMSCCVIKDIFKTSNIEFRFKVIAWDEVAKENMKSILNKKQNHDEYNYIREKLSTLKVDGRNLFLDLGIDIDDIRISLNHINMYKKYLNNKIL